MSTPQIYTLDCEFDGYQGRLLSLALFSPERSFYARVCEPEDATYTPWVKEHVVPFLDVPRGPEALEAGGITIQDFDHHFNTWVSKTWDGVSKSLEEFFAENGRVDNPRPVRIHTDWPDDVKYFSELLLTGPGTMINIPSVEFKVNRVDSYPTRIAGAVQHNAWWDAFVLYDHLNEQRRELMRKLGSRGGVPRWPTF